MTYELPIYTDEELAKATSYPPLECGNYEFDVIHREEGTASNHSHMEKITLDVFHRGRSKKPMKCYHTFFIKPKEVDAGDHLRDVKKAKDFLDNINIPYTANAFSRVIGAKGRANFLVTNYISKKDGKEREKFALSDDSFIEDILPVTTVSQKNQESQTFNDDIPF